jgi:hypothetical protein
MSQVLVWRSDADGKLFEDKKKYQAHLHKLARHRYEQKKLEHTRREADAVWAKLYELEIDIAHWPKLVIDNQKLFWAEAAKNTFDDWNEVGKKKRKGQVMPWPELLEFTKFRVSWSDQVSNSHSRPHNGVENWGGREKLPDGTPAPRHYPGWTGMIEWIVKWPQEFDGVYLGSNLFRSHGYGRQRAYTGTGGGGSMHYHNVHKCHVQTFGYDVSIYAAVWPCLARLHSIM